MAIRFTTRAAQRRSCSIPSCSSAKPIWTAASSSSRARSPMCSPLLLGQHRDGRPPPGRVRNGCCVSLPPADAIQSAPAGPTQCRSSLRSRRRLYALFLDADRQYSCAYFEHPDQSLDDAQLAKKRHLAAKLLLEPRPARARHRLRLGRAGALSRRDLRRARHRHHAFAASSYALRAPRARPRRACPSQVEFRLQDYRDVARDNSTASSRSACSSMSASASTTPSSANARELLDDDGVMLLHSIGRSEGPNVTNPWIAKYIFPGGYIPALSEVLPAVERAGLAGHRHRNPAPALCRDAQGLARALPRASRRGRAHL